VFMFPTCTSCLKSTLEIHASNLVTHMAGYYPAGVRGIGGSAVMFVLSTEDWFGGTWYMLNQVPCVFVLTETL